MSLLKICSILVRRENLTGTNIGTDTGTNSGTNTVTYTSTAANNRALSIK